MEQAIGEGGSPEAFERSCRAVECAASDLSLSLCNFLAAAAKRIAMELGKAIRERMASARSYRPYHTLVGALANQPRRN